MSHWILDGTLSVFRSQTWLIVFTDTLQAVFMYGGVLMVIIKGSMDSGGFRRVFEIATNSGRVAPLGYVDPNPLQYMSIWITIFGGTSFWFSLYGLNQMAIQRYCSLPSLRHAQIVIGITAPAYIILGSLCCLIGKGCQTDPKHTGLTFCETEEPWRALQKFSIPDVSFMCVKFFYVGKICPWCEM